MSGKLGRPSLVWSFTEGMRMQVELVAYLAVRKQLLAVAGSGRGKPVVFSPGFGGGDYTTKIARMFLNEIGFNATAVGAGTNLGPTKKSLEQYKNELFRVSDQYGQPVSWVDHSLSGIIVRELARQFPDHFEQVITLCSPFGAGMEPNTSAPFVREIFEAINGRNNGLLGDPAMAKQMITPPPVPTTALYTRHDGVVNWRTCINPISKMTENIEIVASHCGMIWNPVALLVIADRLTQDLSGGSKDWEPFIPSKYPSFLLVKDQAHFGHEPKLEKPSQNILKLFP